MCWNVSESGDQVLLSRYSIAVSAAISFGVLISSNAVFSGSPVIVPAGPRAAKIFFQAPVTLNGSTAGTSFDRAPGGGTPAVPGSGLPAVRVYNPDGSGLATGGPSAATWPKWLTSFEIGISGTNNSTAISGNCARFSGPGEDTASNCNFLITDPSAGTPGTRNGAAGFNCGATPGFFRVSEFDCASGGTTVDGNGGPSDGVYIRATFSRNGQFLAPNENIMVVLEYAASTVNGAPQSPTQCFANGSFTPTLASCSDMSWQIFLKHSTTEIVQPFLLLVPPAFAALDSLKLAAGSGVATKQFFMPLASDPNLNTLQISRIRGLAPDGASAPLTPPRNIFESCVTNGALCDGMVFRSITFYRM